MLDYPYKPGDKVLIVDNDGAIERCYYKSAIGTVATFTERVSKATGYVQFDPKCGLGSKNQPIYIWHIEPLPIPECNEDALKLLKKI